MATHVQQHYVPKFLLEQWHAGPDEKLCAMRWAHGKLDVQRYKAKSVARMSHLYSLRRADGTWDVTLERDFLGPHVDEPAAAVHRILNSGQLHATTGQQKAYWARFLVSLAARGPAAMARLRELAKSDLFKSLEAAPEEYEAVRGDASQASLLEFAVDRDPALLDDFGLRLLPRVIQTQVLTEEFFEGRTWILKPVKLARRSFLIGDRPLILSGHLEQEHMFVLPLSPRLLFAVASSEAVARQAMEQRTDDDLVREVNLQMILQSETWVFGADTTQMSFVRKHLAKPAC